MKKTCPKIFCLDNNLGIVYNRHFFAITTFNKRNFKCLIMKYIKSKEFHSADMLLKVVMKEYVGLDEFCIRFHENNMSDSQFYMKWRNIIKDNKTFIKNAKPLLEKKQKKHEAEVHERNVQREIKATKSALFVGVAKHKRIVIGGQA